MEEEGRNLPRYYYIYQNREKLRVFLIKQVGTPNEAFIQYEENTKAAFFKFETINSPTQKNLYSTKISLNHLFDQAIDWQCTSDFSFSFKEKEIRVQYKVTVDTFKKFYESNVTSLEDDVYIVEIKDDMVGKDLLEKQISCSSYYDANDNTLVIHLQIQEWGIRKKKEPTQALQPPKGILKGVQKPIDAPEQSSL